MKLGDVILVNGAKGAVLIAVVVRARIKKSGDKKHETTKKESHKLQRKP